MDFPDSGPPALHIVTVVSDPETLWDIWLLPVSGERKPERYLASRYIEWMPSISPDGKWMHASNESGPSEVYINSFPRAVRRSESR